MVFDQRSQPSHPRDPDLLEGWIQWRVILEGLEITEPMVLAFKMREDLKRYN
jgi:hypothetical protein